MSTEVQTVQLTPLVAAPDEGAQVMALFQQAIAAGNIGVEALGKLVDLHERVQRRRAELEFAGALAEFQGSCRPVPRSSRAEIVTKSGAKFGYAYADLEQIMETTRPELSRLGFSVTFDSSTDGAMLSCTASLRHRNGHAVTSTFQLPTASASAMSDQQKVGAALTFAKRQCIVAVLGLSLTDPDPEGEVDPTTIGREQQQTIASLMAETGANVEKFNAHFGITALSELRTTQYDEAVRMLERKRKGGAA